MIGMRILKSDHLAMGLGSFRRIVRHATVAQKTRATLEKKRYDADRGNWGLHWEYRPARRAVEKYAKMTTEKKADGIALHGWVRSRLLANGPSEYKPAGWKQ
eukprot:3728801-Pyramimonas_sp.AAC.1